MVTKIKKNKHSKLAFKVQCKFSINVWSILKRLFYERLVVSPSKGVVSNPIITNSLGLREQV